ncbi:hypothetical protein [Cupriavidus sp. AcVe19-6a]|uniref:hypothetical protein n=1 Tax=Cupriavidus sp. AcVe19-6a TaxID=2821358 RepID=UPI001AE1DA72|nr:hypothetical protein [Cupriavidus sp. AcVe19-6a]MBP0635535.1 hypothetical protein [Cupriavidus sp. AcVe19-6a]
MNLSEAFRHYGATLRNRLYDVSALTDTDPPELVFAPFEHWPGWRWPGKHADLPRNVCEYRDDLRLWGQSPAIPEVRRHMRQAHEQGLPVRLVLARLLDPERDGGQVDAGQNAQDVPKEFHVRPELVGRVTEFDGEAFCIRFERHA